MPSYTENAFAAALNAVDSGDPIRRVAHDYGIPRTMLQHRLAGRQAKTTVYMFQQKLSPVQESRLAEWICIFASRILFAGGSATGIGKHWLKGFLRRNPYVKTL